MRNTAWKGGFLQYSFRKISLFFWQNSMVQRVSMINSNKTQLNSDYDFSMLRKWLLWNQGGVESKTHFSFDVSTKRLSAGADIAVAYILCTRPSSSPIPNQQFLAHFEFTGTLDFLNITDGDKIFIEIKENLIKDPTLIEDLDIETNYAQGLGIGEIKMAKNYPGHNNYLKLYEWNWGKLVDHRKEISLPALDSVAERTTTLESKLQTQEQKVGKLEEAGTPDHLSLKEIIGEKYKASDLLTRAYLPLSANSDIPLNFWETAENKELHIQRISSGHTDNKIKIKLKKKWNPTSNVTIEVRKGVKVESGDTVYRYGGEVLATATIQANQITTARKEFTATLDKSPLLARGELYSVVVKCQGSVYHNADFYQIACSGEWSEAFCAIQVNDTSRVRTDYMPYCESSMFLDYCLAKRSDATKETVLEVINLTGSSSYEHYFTLTEDNQKIAIHSTWREIERVYFYNGGTQIWSMWYWASGSVELSAKKWDTIRIQIRVRVASGVNITVYRRLKKPCPKILYPKELKNVWEVVECTIYWLHDNVFVWDQIDTTPTSSATTGRLTLGNAVAFFSIIGNDGKTYKFPVYWA